MVSNVYDADLLITVQDHESLEKIVAPEEDDDEEAYFRWFVGKVMSV